MATGTISLRIWVKHLWLLKAINIPLVLMGFKPYIPGFCVGFETDFKDMGIE